MVLLHEIFMEKSLQGLTDMEIFGKVIMANAQEVFIDNPHILTKFGKLDSIHWELTSNLDQC